MGNNSYFSLTFYKLIKKSNNHQVMCESTLKQKVMDSIEKLPQDASLDDIIERIYLIHKIEAGLKQSQQGVVIHHEEILKRPL